MTVDSQLVSSIGKGVLVFAGVSDKDSRKEVEAMASKVLKMKMWPDESGGTVRTILKVMASCEAQYSHPTSSGNRTSRTSRVKFYAVRLPLASCA